mmetsp:Transcript_6964/g.7791  ORF Transcript_6964/g.7791 Transcript_6964/m.7791 type:complete len:165 (+) Transcript_6964:441-935(+)
MEDMTITIYFTKANSTTFQFNREVIPINNTFVFKLNHTETIYLKFVSSIPGKGFTANAIIMEEKEDPKEAGKKNYLFLVIILCVLAAIVVVVVGGLLICYFKKNRYNSLFTDEEDGVRDYGNRRAEKDVKRYIQNEQIDTSGNGTNSSLVMGVGNGRGRENLLE